MRTLLLHMGAALLLSLPLLVVSDCSKMFEPGHYIESNTSLPTCPPRDDPNAATYFPDPYNCSRFYQCSNGIPYLHECPNGLQFNTDCGVCDMPENANCVPSKAEILFPIEDCSYGEIKPNLRDKTCSSFIYCTGSDFGEPGELQGEIMVCPGNLRFDPYRLVCNYPETVPCDSDTIRFM